MKQQPIGVFDSGLGGLTAVRRLREMLPGEDIVYFGDTGRVPYGSRGRDTIIGYARQDIALLLSKGVKAILAACGTVSSTFPEEEGDGLPVGYMGVVGATAAAAARATKGGRIAILGTEATISSGSYQRALAALAPGTECFAVACPLFVPLVENGHFAEGDELATLAAREYLAGLAGAGVDTVILGCTHYPLLKEVIAGQFPANVCLIDSGAEAARALRRRLEEDGLLRGDGREGRLDSYVSDHPARFDRLARLFLGDDAVATAQRVHIEDYHL